MPSMKGRREDRVSSAPAALRVKVENTQVSHHRFTGNSRPSLRDGFNGFLRARPGDRAFLSPSPRNAPALSRVDISVGISGPHDFTVRVRCIRHVHRQRPSHPAPNVRDDREAPLFSGTGRADSAGDLRVRSTATRWHDGQITLRAQSIVNRNLLVSRTRRGAISAFTRVFR